MADLPLHTLLPLRGLTITLDLTDSAHFSFYHQAAVYALVRHLAGLQENFADLLTIDAPESGRIDYREGDLYRFALIALPGAEAALARVLTGLARLPASAPVRDIAVPLRDNLRLAALEDLFTGEQVRTVADLALYSGDEFAREQALWRAADAIQLQFLSPARLLRALERRPERGEQRYCHALADLGDGILAARIYDSLAELMRRRGADPPRRVVTPGIPAPAGHLFWVDSEYRDAHGQTKPIGGVCGRVHIGPGRELAEDWLACLVLGQYLGIGQRRVFGLGRYRLRRPDGSSTAMEAEPAASLLARCSQPERLYDAYTAIAENRARRAAAERPAADVSDFADAYPELPDPEEAEQLADRLDRLAARLAAGEYQPPPLAGVVIREPDGDLRGLAIPPFWDRVCQRAVNDLIAPACDLIQSTASHGYRRGYSRHTASDAINRAYREGYRWIYEADIADFFDSVDWRHLSLRLEALYRDDPVIELILAWMAAPVDYQGMTIERTAGLPQGAPLSPTLANLMLDSFDTELEHAGFRVVRYADDFVVLCKDRDQAEVAGQAVRAALAELGLGLNEPKSRAVSFEQGFKFLGFLFMNDLVLDVGGERAEPVAAKQSTPSGWMARLARRTPRPVTEAQSEDGAAAPPAVPADAPLTAGERDDTGMLLIVSGPPALVATRNDRVVVTRDDHQLTDAPWRSLSALLLIGSQHITTPALRAALAADVPVHLANAAGKYQGTAWSARAGAAGAGLWLAQRQRFADAQWSLEAAIAVVQARLRHQREVLRQRDPGGFVRERAALERAIADARKASEREALLGIEGAATRQYFGALAALVPEAYGFDGRTKRPPRDPFNALLSLGYTLLHGHVQTLIQVAGLYPWLGFYHVARGTHPALASDLVEPFRHIVERAALAMVGRGGLAPAAFRNDTELGCRLTAPALKRYLAEIWGRLERPVGRVGDGESHSVLLQIHRQNRRLIEAIRRGGEFEPWMVR